jgi:photosystem II stability/assembly factor-like uncharacterized protein
MLEERFTVGLLRLPLLSVLFALAVGPATTPDEKKPEPFSSETLSGLAVRSIGPAVTSGRVVGFAVDPGRRDRYFVAVACGGVWSTVNGGTTWSPVFDNEGSYSIGQVVSDPKHPQTVWVGSGENNNQRSVGYGDGVYRSDDGGKSWKNVGLKKSEHIGRIAIDPRNSDAVYVAAPGPLWGPGGDRGLYKTTDGGKTWKQVLSISENTGIADVVIDPANPNVVLAAAHQRRRHVFTLIHGGPESAIWKSTDAGATWRKLKTGLPTEDLGRIGLALAGSQPHMVYAIIESIDKKGGIFRSADFGETWERRNEFDQQAQYYAHLVVDPKDANRVYVMSVFMQVSDDGCKTLHNLGEKFKHVDNHEIWIDPHDTDFLRVGCDGGIYESHDRGANWRFIANLPVTQFYDIAADTEGPFYHVYGGTQDNFTLGGPARNRKVNGIANSDWFVTQGGDGFHTRADPQDPNTVYAEAQYGVLVRYDRTTGQAVGIQPQQGKDEPPLRWNWDSPFFISPHLHTRIYFAANKLFRSDDRGDTWRAVSGDLTRQLNRDELEVMGKIWSPDAVSKSVSTSFYGNIVALSESPKKEGVIYVGTDDGLIQVTDNGGQSWTRYEKFANVPERTYVSRLLASAHDAGTVYAAFDRHKNADFAPYLQKSTDSGKTWKAIQGDLPANGPVLAIAEDPVKPDLLFAGTEFGVFFTVDGGQKWLRLKGGMPTIAVRDLAIQRQMNDLVIGTFGRGIYILDDYSVLRDISPAALAKDFLDFPIRNAPLYIPERPLGLPGKSFQGSGYYAADNPPYGATVTYYLKDDIKTEKEERREKEKNAAKKKEKVAYPKMEELRAEAEEEAPVILIRVMDSSGKTIRNLTGPAKKGFHRVTWDLRVPAPVLPKPRMPEQDDDLFSQPPIGPLVMPGSYRMSLSKRVKGVTMPLGSPREFRVELVQPSGTSDQDLKDLIDFENRVTDLARAVNSALEAANGLTTRLEQIEKAIDHTPVVESKWHDTVRSLIQRNRGILRALRGDVILRGRNENTPISISERVQTIIGDLSNTLAKPTGTDREGYAIAGGEFADQLSKLRTLMDVDLKELEHALDIAGAPWTPGRLPEWKEK